MGMAASQARFLSLTARKSNVEYEGQQVNQQRTALSNESANLYNRLTSIPVPTPPVTSDYYETVYTFSTSELSTASESGSTQYTLDNIYSTPSGNYASLYYTAYQWEPAVNGMYSGDISIDDKGNYSVTLANGTKTDAVKYHYEPSQVELTVQPDENGTIAIGGTQFTFDAATNTIKNGTNELKVTKLGNGKYSVAIPVDKNEQESKQTSVNFCGLIIPLDYNETTGQYVLKLDNVSAGRVNSEILGRYVDDNGNPNAGASYLNSSFLSTNNGTKENQPILAYVVGNQTYYVSAQETEGGVSFASSSYVQSVGRQQHVNYPCEYTTAPTGRYQTLSVTDENGNQHTFNLTVQNVENEAEYKQAMLDYEYEQAKYQKEIADINAKTESLQQEDRTLELRLKQLDTEQNAINTEMEAVSKIIEQNIEATFKTFA